MFLSLKKNPEDSRSDLWILCPYEERFNANCLSALLRSALERLNILFPGFTLKGDVPRLDFCNEYFLLYAKRNMFARHKTHPLLFHLNPESAGKIDAYSIMRDSELCLSNIKKTVGAV